MAAATSSALTSLPMGWRALSAARSASGSGAAASSLLTHGVSAVPGVTQFTLAECLPGLGDGGANRVVVGHVGDERVKVGALRVRLDPVQRGDAGTAGGQQPGGGQADPGGAPGDQRRQPGELGRLLCHRSDK